MSPDIGGLLTSFSVEDEAETGVLLLVGRGGGPIEPAVVVELEVGLPTRDSGRDRVAMLLVRCNPDVAGSLELEILLLGCLIGSLLGEVLPFISVPIVRARGGGGGPIVVGVVVVVVVPLERVRVSEVVMVAGLRNERVRDGSAVDVDDMVNDN